MAEENEDKKKDKDKKKGGIVRIIIIFLIILVVLIGGFIALLKLDVAGLGTKIIGPSIKDIPGASLILPEMPEEEIIEGEESNTYETLDQAVEILKVTENLLKEKEEEAEKLNEQIVKLQLEIERLKEFETSYLQFETDKANFDQMIVVGTDSNAFSKWYETMNPDNAAKIYADVIGQQSLAEELKDQIDTFSEMKPDEAAAILSETAVTRLEMVATIIKHLEAGDAAKILGAMDSKLASRITVYLHPEE